METKVYRPIIFSGPGSVEAILQGRKTMTRRLIAEGNSSCTAYLKDLDFNDVVREDGYIKVAKPGDGTRHRVWPVIEIGNILWVREAFYALGKWVKNGQTKKGKQRWKFKDRTLKMNQRYLYQADTKKPSFIATKKDGVMHWYKRQAIFMPKAAARIFLEVTAIKVERIQEISSFDCISEGILPLNMSATQLIQQGQLYQNYMSNERLQEGFTPTLSFASLWIKINGRDSFKANPWVFAYTFKKVAKPGDFLLKKWKRNTRALVFDALEWGKKGDIGDNTCFYKPATIVNIRNDSSGRQVADVIFDYNKESGEVSHGHFIEGLKQIENES